MMNSRIRQRVVIVGAGFGGFNAARELSRRVGATTDIMVINSADYFLYLPLMPQVAGGVVEPRHVCVSLPRRLRRVQFVLGRCSGWIVRKRWSAGQALRAGPGRSAMTGSS